MEQYECKVPLILLFLIFIPLRMVQLKTRASWFSAKAASIHCMDVAEFGYNGLLYLNFTGRNDWFSVLNPDYNSKFYPSVSGSFIFSELLKNVNWLSYGKLRASWAQVGSIAGVNPYDGVLTYSINANLFNGQTLASINGGNCS